MNRQLTRHFSEDEIRKAAFAINPEKAAGLDGIQSFFAENRLPQRINHTSITLIPKIQTPVSMADLRPISLCPVYYKILSRFSHKQAPKDHSDDCQRKPKRLYQRGNQCYELALKLDMSKAYERIEWIFVKRVLRMMAFHFVWNKWIMECISSVTYSLNFNGAVHGFISSTRGLRQSDPLSPLIFTIYAECFSSLLFQAEGAQLISSVHIAPQSPLISHLLFADDSLLFVQASHFQASNVRRILQILEVSHVGGQDKYLGLPAFINKSKRETFNDIYSKVRHKVVGWKENLLSMGGREHLIKSIAMAIPVFAMSCFLLLKCLGK
ncbi:uncharacterized protein LOC126681881 [Mercurialis annua]|uniref:uncharacterized protein LOC126681881 n=1 Tax=Mercurialis annua TaxID=3986 RepID=UPI00215DE695|nr:uncharacterized protein LOC126681881 [Mercurialis annua]